ncbi:MAG TPA: hypothetical protein VKB88_08585 [Bryobacteraceae bacterium]|nr:hypothetical protein [Bryobacteraceae bacterium]
MLEVALHITERLFQTSDSRVGGRHLLHQVGLKPVDFVLFALMSLFSPVIWVDSEFKSCGIGPLIGSSTLAIHGHLEKRAASGRSQDAVELRDIPVGGGGNGEGLEDSTPFCSKKKPSEVSDEIPLFPLL